MRAPDEVLDDSEASLRLVEQAIDELSVSSAELDRDRREFLLSAIARADAVVEALSLATEAERPQLLASLKDELQALASHLHPRAPVAPCSQSLSK